MDRLLPTPADMHEPSRSYLVDQTSVPIGMNGSGAYEFDGGRWIALPSDETETMISIADDDAELPPLYI